MLLQLLDVFAKLALLCITFSLWFLVIFVNDDWNFVYDVSFFYCLFLEHLVNIHTIYFGIAWVILQDPK
jgi:hypothetical protein